MNESTGSITSKFVKQLQVEGHPQVEELLTDLVETEEKLERAKEENAKILYDAARWNHAKNKLYRELGFSSPLQMQLVIDNSMSREAEKC